MNLADLQKIVDEKINPVLDLHKGSCELVNLENNSLYIKLKGGCVGCPSSTITLYNGIIPIFNEAYPNLDVILV